MNAQFDPDASKQTARAHQGDASLDEAPGAANGSLVSRSRPAESSGRKRGVAQRVGESRAYLPWGMPAASAIAGFFMFPFAALAVLVPIISHGGAWNVTAGVVGGLLLAATGAHLLWEAVEFGKRQDAASSQSDPKRPLVFGKLTLGAQLRWRAVDAALFASALLIPWLIRSAGKLAHHM